MPRNNFRFPIRSLDIRIAIRSLARQKVLTIINVSGLSLGLACFSLILLFTVSEFGYDKFHQKAARIYRVDQTFVHEDGQLESDPGVGLAPGPALRRDFPDVEAYVRISAASQKLIKSVNGPMRLSMSFADTGFFSIFSFPLIAGNAQQALRDPHAVVVTRSKAIQLFGTEDAVGKTVQVKIDTAYQPFLVSGVAADLPNNSSVRFDMLGSYEYLFQSDTERRRAVNDWNETFGDQTYVLLRPGSLLPKEQERLLQFRWRHMPEEAEHYHGDRKIAARFGLQPLQKVHIDPTVEGRDTTDPRNIWILLAIASGILLIAAINFTTLAIARSAGRAIEVGVRKVVGGRRPQLIRQFLTESVVLSVVSTVLGIGLALVLLPWFNELSDKHLAFSFSQYPQLAWMLAGLTLLVGLLAGSYPALVLSGFDPVDVLKSRIRLGGSNYFTRGLVTLQFVLSIGLIIGTVIILRQVSFMRGKDLGLIKENTVVVYTEDAEAAKDYPLLRQALASDKAVMGVTAAEIGLGEGQGEMGGGYEINGMKTGVIEYPVDYGFLPVMGMRLVAGRNFDPAITGDTVGNVIVNETLVKNDLGVSPQQAIGMQLKQGGGKRRPVKYKTIIGVARDFNFERLNKLVRPQLFYVPAHIDPACYFIHLRGGDPTPTLAAIGDAWKSFAPDVPLRYSFLDEELDRFYRSEMRWGNIIAFAGGLSIFLATLGLFGLAALAAVNRIKEIGIRRVLGASGFEIVHLLTSDFLRLVMVAAVIASPMAWYFMNKWLQQFAFRIDIGWWIFAGTALGAVAIAYITIGVQAWRAAQINPVKNLRTE